MATLPKPVAKPVPVAARPAVPTPKPVAAKPAAPVIRPAPVARPVARPAAPPPPPEPTPEEVQEQEAAVEETQAIVPAGSQELAAPGQWDDVLAQYAEDIVADVPIPGGAFIGLKAGIISVAGSDYDALDVVALDHCFENTLYDGAYDEENPRNPICFAFARKEEELAPHPDAEAPQAATCAECPMNQWGTGTDRDGNATKGKACQNRRRVALISTNGLTPESVETTEVVYLKTPVTSSKIWDNYVRFLQASTRRPPFAVFTQMSTKPDKENQFKLVFQLVGAAPDEYVAALVNRYKIFKEADTLLFPYGKNAPQEQATEEQAAEAAEAPPPARPVAPARPAARPAPAPRKF